MAKKKIDKEEKTHFSFGQSFISCSGLKQVGVTEEGQVRKRRPQPPFRAQVLLKVGALHTYDMESQRLAK